MAARIGAGTGVIVSLVVFLLTTIFLLILAIVFYSGKANAEQALATNQKNVAKFIKPDEQASEWIKAAEVAAGPAKSIARHQQEQSQKLVSWLTGNPDDGVDVAGDKLKSFGVGDQRSASAVLSEQRGQLKTAGAEIDRLKAEVASRQAEVEKFISQLQDQAKSHDIELKTATASIEEYRAQAQKLFTEVQELKDFLRQESDKTKDRYEAQIAALNADLDNSLQENAVFRSRIRDFEERMNEIRVQAANPAMLVDGRVIEAAGADTVYIDRGREQRVVLGMTFEIYDDERNIRVDPQTGLMPRGKASLQVTNVRATSSECKVTRLVAGRPIVKGDVIANAIYDPTYKFKFLVHGKFDLDTDGKATEAEAEFLRDMVLKWGGTIITGETLPGDLDFLVLGEEPPEPVPLRPDASDMEQRIYIERKGARVKYQQLRDQATQAQIPLLNSNRFLILIGYTAR